MDWTEVTKILSAIVLIGAAAGVIYKWISPAFKAKSTIAEHENRLNKIEEHEKNDLEMLKDMQMSIKQQNRAMLAVVNHMIDGNGIDRLRQSRDELTDLLMR